MNLTRGQEEAIAMAKKAIDAQKSGTVIRLSGAAGTGKTTCLKQIIAEVGDAHIVAPTGKAALRAKEATGYQNAQTVHRWLYLPIIVMGKCIGFAPRIGNPDREQQFRPKSGLIICDEASMVAADVWRDLKFAVEEL